MAMKTDRSHECAEEAVGDATPGYHLTTVEEGTALFDRRARSTLGISGREFLRRWDAGEYRSVPDTVEGRKVRRLFMLMPFARRAKT